ncbi:MAG TPA: SLC13 family permease, partial [Opitutales bacterium]|nr:SLC13 family permease [Opitutales bacterium]
MGIGIYLLPHPESIADSAWRLAAIFVATIVGIVLQPLPMGAVAVLGLTATTLTHSLTIHQALNGFGQHVVWLVVLVFFISRGFIKTNLGSRVAYLFIRAIGKHTLGLGYGLAMTDLAIAPVMPSTTARCGGIIMPILQSINHALGSFGHNNSRRHVGAYLTQVTFQTNIITSAMFLTAMVGNPMAQTVAAKMGIEITWMSWFTAAIVPGIASLI